MEIERGEMTSNQIPVLFEGVVILKWMLDVDPERQICKRKT